MSKKTNAKKGKKTQVPRFWWDFNSEGNGIMVESNDGNHPVVAVFPYDPNGGYEASPDMKKLLSEFFGDSSARIGQAEVAIRLAEKLIDDLKAGRQSHRKINYKKRAK